MLRIHLCVSVSAHFGLDLQKKSCLMVQVQPTFVQIKAWNLSDGIRTVCGQCLMFTILLPIISLKNNENLENT